MKKTALKKTGTMVIISAMLLAAFPGSVSAEGSSTAFTDQIVKREEEETNSPIQEDEVDGVLSKKYEVTASILNVRSGPGTEYPTLGTLKKGAVIKVKSISEGWAKFSFAGTTGYAYSKYLKKF